MGAARQGTVRPPTARALFYSDDGDGLDGIRRTLAITRELSRRFPDAALVALHGCPKVRAFSLPACFDDVQLPPLSQEALFRDLPAVPGDDRPPDDGSDSTLPPPTTLRGLSSLREAIATATARSYAPQLVLVDRSPAGVGGELAPQALRLLAAAGPRPLLVLGLPDVLGEPEIIRRQWQDVGIAELLETVYDRILVYGDGQVADPVAEYGLSSAAAAKVVFCGYLAPDPPARSPEAIRAELAAGEASLVVCGADGGTESARLIRTLLGALRRPELIDLRAFVAAGPLLPDDELAALTAEAEGLPGLTLVPFAPDFTSYVNAADVVVTTGGYDAVREAIGLGKRPVIVPRLEPSTEQLVRASRLEALGLATVLRPDSADPVRLARAIRAELDAGFSPPPLLDFGGLYRAGDVLAEALSYQPSAISRQPSTTTSTSAPPRRRLPRLGRRPRAG
jgi:predicted glycosyltransferase